jgi:hypothetical protein
MHVEDIGLISNVTVFVYRPEVWAVLLGPAGVGCAPPSGSGGANSGAASWRPQHCTGTYRPSDLSRRCRRVSMLLLGAVAPASTQASGRWRQCLDTSHS